MGVAGGMIYSLILILCVAFMCVRFMKRSNVMDIINEQRKQEPLKKSVSFFYLISGIVMILVGVIIGYFLPIITVKVSGHWLGGVDESVLYPCSSRTLPYFSLLHCLTQKGEKSPEIL